MSSYPVIHSELKTKLEHFRLFVQRKAEMLNEYMAKAGLSGIVLNLSGGIDSSTVLGMAKYASKLPSSPIKKIIAINQPIHSSHFSYKRAKEVAELFKVEFVIIDQTDINTNLVNNIQKITDITPNDFAKGQLRSYMRTPVGTGNFDEDGYLMYFCKAGDGIVDVQLIADLHKSEVYKVGAYLGLPTEVINAKPSADLWVGQTDEDELGFTYDFVELFTTVMNLSEYQGDKLAFFMDLSKEALVEYLNCARAAEGFHRRNLHKKVEASWSRYLVSRAKN